MTAAEVALLVLGIVLLALWIVRHIFISRALRRQSIVQPDPAAALPDDVPELTIVVAARDEEENIADCIASLRRLRYPKLEFIVADDRSSDRTAEIVRQIALEEPRLRLVQITELPAGWFGKCNAMQTAAREARSQWLLFVDADCRLSPHGVSAVIRHVLAEKGDLLSLWPSLTLSSFGERLLMPMCGSLLAVYHRPELANNPKSSTAFANGQFILVRRKVFEGLGGFEAVRNVLVEDIAFARHVKQSGYRALSAVSRDIFSVRMYSSFRAVWRGWSRIFSGAFHSAGSYLLAIALVLLVSFGPYVYTATTAAGAAARGWQSTTWNILLTLGVLQIVAMLLGIARFYRLANGPVGYVLLHPLALVLMFSTLLKGLAIKLGWSTVSWRGRTYRGASNLTR